MSSQLSRALSLFTVERPTASHIKRKQFWAVAAVLHCTVKRLSAEYWRGLWGGGYSREKWGSVVSGAVRWAGYRFSSVSQLDSQSCSRQGHMTMPPSELHILIGLNWIMCWLVTQQRVMCCAEQPFCDLRAESLVHYVTDLVLMNVFVSDKSWQV